MIFDSIKAFLDDISSLLPPILESKTEHEESANRFNFFEVVSDFYRRETFHSDVLATLLNPKTKEIGDICKNIFLCKFLDLFNVPFNPKESYIVCTENPANTEESNGRIDISIVGNGYTIIIENKINFAAEQKNQLARYVTSVREKNPNNKIVIVYLTLIPDESQKPTVEAYDKKYQPIVREFNNTIPLHLWAASNTRDADGWNTPSLINLLDDCIKRIVGEEKPNSVARTALVFMEQYRNLLEEIGGEKMERDAKLEILDYLGNSEKESELLTEIIEERHALFANFFEKRYKSEKLKWETENIDGYDYFILKSFKNYKVFLWSVAMNLQIGMVFLDKQYGKTKSSEAIKKLTSIIEKHKNIRTIKNVESYSGRGQTQAYYFSLTYNFKPLEEAYQEVKDFIDVFPSEFTEEF